MTDPRWSPEGLYIAANSFDLLTTNILDYETQRWSTLPPRLRMIHPEWSKDGSSIYFRHDSDDPALFGDCGLMVINSRTASEKAADRSL
ncbi:PD40 domain-containing protein [Occallatibacter savannae]|uniref:PD40 domain-containing protein n=1 Tax=Occallatibacter savannae TaxID=1002691 RepID=UPI000D6986C8|nr:PD40 domain-containing protein [Occallatibacter savannae]